MNAKSEFPAGRNLSFAVRLSPFGRATDTRKSVNPEALPYTLLLILIELAVGSLWITVASDLRGGVTRGFVMTMALCVAITAGLAYWTAGVIDLRGSVDGYRIDEDPFDDVKRATMVVIVTSAVYMFCVFMGWDPIGRTSSVADWLTDVVGIVAGLLVWARALARVAGRQRR